MKGTSPLLAAITLAGLLVTHTTDSCAQAIAPEKSARAAALSDTRLIATCIADDQNALLLSQKAMDHAGDGRIKELAQQMVEDHSTMLYEMQQLASAGGSSADQSAGNSDNRQRQAAELDSRLSGLSGADFDTLWVSGVLKLQLASLDELTQAKETVTNPQLKTIITEAISITRKHSNRLKVLQKDLAKLAIQKKKQGTARQAR